MGISKKPNALLTLNIEQLKEAEERLSKIDRFKNILSENNITKERYTNAITFERSIPHERANAFAKRVFAQATQLTDASYMLKLSDDFPLNVKQFILFLSDKESISDMMSEIKQIPQQGKNPLFILASTSEQQAKLAEERKKGFEQFVVVEPKVLTQMLLVADGSKCLADAFAGQLALTTISPYNLGGGESNSAMFFGRREIISHIVSRENNNYIVVGSRQIGKSSLLKALEREYRNNKELVYYIQVGQSSIVRAIARAFGLKTKRLEELVEYLSAQKEKAIILLDEVDPFVRHEKEEGYQVLDAMRKLSEEGRCKFILAGYWELYRYSMLDNQSPLKNFGEILELGALEYEACEAMINEPMAQLGIGFKQKKSIEEIIERTGQRPNLIAIICNTLIKNLGKTKRTIEHAEVEAVFSDKKLYELFESWKELDDDKRAGSIDKMIVYAMVEQEKFKLKDLVEKLKTLGVNIAMSEIEKSLSRLKIGYIIERDNEGVYGFMLPLFRAYILKDEYEVKLMGELKELL
jgi:predicted AAA+ superfamily ATPase